MQLTTNPAQAWLVALETGDDEALLELYHEHAFVETPWRRVHGRAHLADVLDEIPPKVRRLQVIAMDVRADEASFVTRHGPFLAAHTMYLVDGLIRTHSLSLSAEP